MEGGRGHSMALPRGTRRIQATLGTCRSVGVTGDHPLRVHPSPFSPGHVTPPWAPAGWAPAGAIPVFSPVPGLLFPLCAGDSGSPESRGNGPRGGRLGRCGCPHGRLGWALSPLELRTPAGPPADPGGEDLAGTRQREALLGRGPTARATASTPVLRGPVWGPVRGQGSSGLLRVPRVCSMRGGRPAELGGPLLSGRPASGPSWGPPRSWQGLSRGFGEMARASQRL